MVVPVQKVGDTFTVVLPAQVAREWNLAEGDMIEVAKADAAVIQHASVEEVLRAYDETLPDHAGAYRELAK